MVNRAEAVHTIKVFLLVRGFEPEREQTDVHDGHWMLAHLPELQHACCPVSFETGLRNVLALLEQGYHWEGERLVMSESDWTPEDTVVVLKKADVPLQPKRASK